MPLLEQERKKALFKVIGVSLGASVMFLVAIQLLGRFIADHSEDPAIRWLVALPGIALTAVVAAAMRNLRRMDELERKIHAEAMAFAFLCSILLITSCGFLMVAGVPTLAVPWLSPAMMICWVIGLLLAFQRYR
jgi:hypothetical protein